MKTLRTPGELFAVCALMETPTVIERVDFYEACTANHTPSVEFELGFLNRDTIERHISCPTELAAVATVAYEFLGCRGIKGTFSEPGEYDFQYLECNNSITIYRKV